MIIAILLVLIVGVIAGVTLAGAAAEYWASTEAGRRQLALREAEGRVRDAQTAALNRMADVAAEVVLEQTSPGPSRWPSEPVIDGEVVRTEP